MTKCCRETSILFLATVLLAVLSLWEANKVVRDDLALERLRLRGESSSDSKDVSAIERQQKLFLEKIQYFEQLVSEMEATHTRTEEKLREQISRLEAAVAASDSAEEQASREDEQGDEPPSGFPPTVVTVATQPRTDLLGAYTNPTLMLLAIAHKHNWQLQIFSPKGTPGEEQLQEQWEEGHDIDPSWGSGFVDANNRKDYNPVENNRRVHEILGFFPKPVDRLNVDTSKWTDVFEYPPPGKELDDLCRENAVLEDGLYRCRIWLPSAWQDETERHDHDIIQKHILENGGFDAFFTHELREEMYQLFMAKNSHRIKHFSDDTYDVAIHVRRGDEVQSIHPERWIEQTVYATIARRICKQHPDAVIHIFSAGKNKDGGWDDLEAAKDTCKSIVYHLDEVEFDTWAHFVAADEFVMSKSTFSYVPALFSMAKVHYPSDYWFGRLGDWVEFSSETGRVLNDSLVASSVSHPTARKRKKMQSADTCDGFDGVLHIAHGDLYGASGTIFFFFVLNQLIYADFHNLKPWVHLNKVSSNVYDESVHGGDRLHFAMLDGTRVSDAGFESSEQWYSCPGKPVPKENAIKKVFQVEGTGVWNSYFEPVSDFDPLENPCPNKPLIRLKFAHILPDLHYHCRWTVRAWRYPTIPEEIRQDELSYQEWLEPQRQRANAIVQKYYRFQPHIRELAEKANPSPIQCLGMHIRHSDKGEGREIVPVKDFLPYAEAYVQERTTSLSSTDPCIFVATDSKIVLEEVQSAWPKNVRKFVRVQRNIARSDSATPVFEIKDASHHRTNTEVLVDILALSQCDFLVHGLSAVSEASIFLNLELHNRSVNLDDPAHMSTKKFREVIHSALSSMGDEEKA